MTKEDTRRVIDKVQKLLALADGAGATPAESAAAAAQAARIMERYKLSQAELAAPDEEAIAADYDLGRSLATLPHWHRMLAFVIAKATGTKTYLWTEYDARARRRQRLKLIGRPSDVAIAQYLFGFCLAEIERLRKEYAERVEIMGLREFNNFRVGCVMTIAQKLGVVKEETRAAASSTAIVRLDQRDAAVEAVAKSMNLRTARKPVISYDAQARALGKLAGEGIEIRKGVGEGTKVKAMK